MITSGEAQVDEHGGQGARGIVLFNRGTNCLVRMVVCLHSLRKWWSGPVTVYLEGGHPEPFLRALRGLGVEIVAVPASPAGNFVRKIETASQSPYDRTLWLDSDTLICGSIDELFDALDHHELVAPHFAGWSSDGKTIRSRVMQYQGLCPDEWLADAVKPHPAVNGGVFAFRKAASILKPWIELSRKGDSVVRLSDEVALQVLLPRFSVGILPCKYNVSVKFPREADDARIIHFHGRKHVRDFPLCDRWKAEFAETRDDPNLDLEAILPWADRQLQRYLKAQPDATIVTACDPAYVEKLRLTFPTWERHKQITRYPIIVFVQGMALDDDRLAFLKHPSVRLIPWEFPVESQREKMLSAFVFGVARHVRTPWWLKLDADAYATDATPLITEEMKRYSLYGHRWGYSFAEHIRTLDVWAGEHPELKAAPIFDSSRVRGRRYYHRRTASFVQLEKTALTRTAVRLGGDRLPVPSQDTYLFYLATLLGHPVGSANFKKHHGMNNKTDIAALRAATGAATKTENVINVEIGQTDAKEP